MAGISFKVLVSDVDETLMPGVNPEAAVMELSKRKACAAVTRLPESTDTIVVAADTVVALDGRIYGKPVSQREAAEMLHSLSGRIHQVFTGVCIAAPNGVLHVFFDRTDVEFYPLTDQEIARYVSTGESMDKAGAYGIQGKGAMLVKGIKGDYYNVMGLPIARVVRELRRLE